MVSDVLAGLKEPPKSLEADVSGYIWMFTFIFSSAVHLRKTDKKKILQMNQPMFFLVQVETVGDKYMTVSGLPEPCTHHAKSICHLALDMMEIAGQVKVDDEPVQVWHKKIQKLTLNIENYCVHCSVCVCVNWSHVKE